MSTTSQPITTEAFQLAIRDLELPLLHTESARLHNSIFHLRRSNNVLEEFKDEEPECAEAVLENNEVIRRQEERIGMIRAEVERRGFRTGHDGGEGRGTGAAQSGVVNGDRGVQNGVSERSENGAAVQEVGEEGGRNVSSPLEDAAWLTAGPSPRSAEPVRERQIPAVQPATPTSTTITTITQQSAQLPVLTTNTSLSIPSGDAADTVPGDNNENDDGVYL